MYRIFLVLDDHFGDRVEALARDTYVWLVQSPYNDASAELVWRESESSDDPLQRGLSTYKRLPGESPEEEIVRLIEMIEDHHGEFAHTPPWSEIEVIGAHVDPQRMEATARDVGATSVVPTPEGLRIVRGA